MAKRRRKAAPVSSAQPAFHERFEVEIGSTEARRRFTNRIRNRIFDELLQDEDAYGGILNKSIRRDVANSLGEEYQSHYSIYRYIEDPILGELDFYKCLHVLETIYKSLPYSKHASAEYMMTRFNEALNSILGESEVDLGITWEDGIFVRSGAKLLDGKLVNESLRWLSKQQYENVYSPFAKGLSHFMESQKRPELLTDAVTDMYEAVEALAGKITGRPSKDLSANAELFIKKIGASAQYKSILKEYISYANQFRHAAQETKARPELSVAEVESFIYLTGLFIRLVIVSTAPNIESNA